MAGIEGRFREPQAPKVEPEQVPEPEPEPVPEIPLSHVSLMLGVDKPRLMGKRERWPILVDYDDTVAMSAACAVYLRQIKDD